MRVWGRWSIAFALATWLAAPACGASVFQCLTTEDCAGRPGGSCEASGHCSFPDETCPSGQRYGEFAPEAFSELCVDPDAGTSTSSGSGADSASSSAGTTTIVPGTGLSDSSGPGSTGTSDGSSTSAITVSGTSGTGSTGGGGTDSSTGETPPLSLIVMASVAACTDGLANDPAACELSTLTQGMSVDASNNGTKLEATTAFVAFELSEVPPGSELLSAQLRLTTTDEPNAESMTQTGEIWQTTAFTLESLSTAQPALVGDAALAADLGGAAASELVVWTLPVAEIDLGATLYLAIVPTTIEGVDYWNNMGAAPPELALEFNEG